MPSPSRSPPAARWSPRPYYYAEDLLGSGRRRAGAVRRRAPADVAAVLDLLDHPDELDAARAEARRVGADLRLAQRRRGHPGGPRRGGRARAGRRRRAGHPGPPGRRRSGPTTCSRLVDDVGIIQHANGIVAEPVHRLLRRRRGPAGRRRAGSGSPARRTRVRPDAVLGARLPAARLGLRARGMHNFMDYDRRWLDDAARTATTSAGRSGPWARWSAPSRPRPEAGTSLRLLRPMAPALDDVTSPRQLAFTVLGLTRLDAHVAVGSRWRICCRLLADRLPAGTTSTAATTGAGSRRVLTYDNARLPQALIAAGSRLGDPDLARAGLEALDWYAAQCGIDDQQRAADRQPVAAPAAPRAGRRRGRRAAAGGGRAGRGAGRGHGVRPATTRTAPQAVRAFEWFLGRNRAGLAGLRLRLRRLSRRARSRRASTRTRARSPPWPSCRPCSPWTAPGCSFVRADRMKIALLGPIAWRTPPRHYGPWEQVTGLLAEGLVAAGHDVTLFATLDSRHDGRPRRRLPAGRTRRTPAWTVGSGRRCTSRTPSPGRPSSTWCTTTSTGCRWPSPRTAGRPCSPPSTGSPTRAILPAYRAADSAYVSISDADRVPELDYLRHGLPRHRPRPGSPFSAGRRARTW